MNANTLLGVAPNASESSVRSAYRSWEQKNSPQVLIQSRTNYVNNGGHDQNYLDSLDANIRQARTQQATILSAYPFLNSTNSSTPQPSRTTTQTPNPTPPTVASTPSTPTSSSANSSFGPIAFVIIAFLILAIIYAIANSSNKGSSNSPAAPTTSYVQPQSQSQAQIPQPTSKPRSVTIQPTSKPAPTSIPRPTVDPRDDIEQAILNFHREMRYLLETLDQSRIRSAASGQALSDRLHAIDVLKASESNYGSPCVWEYDARSIKVTSIDISDSNYATATSVVDSDGHVYCGGRELPQYGYYGPFNAYYTIEKINGKWIVTDYGWE